MKIIIAAWIGSNNLGDELILLALLKQLQSRGIDLNDVTAISKSPNKTSGSLGIHSVGHLAFIKIYKAIRSSDVLVFGGGGILQDDTSIWNLPYHLSRVWIAQWLQKKIITIGIGVGPVNTALGRWLVRMTFRKEQVVLVRDDDSRAVLEDIDIHHATVSTDLVFSLPPIVYEKMGYIAVALRPYSPKGGFLPVSLRRSKNDESYLHDIAKALDATSISTKLPIRFVSFDADKDIEFHQKVAMLMSTPVTFVTPSTDNVAEEIGSANAVIGMRFHAGVLSVLAGRPSVLIGYSPKVLSLSRLVGSGCQLIANKREAFALIPKFMCEVLGKDSEVRGACEQLKVLCEANKETLDGLLGQRTAGFVNTLRT